MARCRAESGGLIFDDRHITYGALAQTVADLTIWLHRHGVAAGDHVAILAGNNPAFVTGMFALWGA